MDYSILPIFLMLLCAVGLALGMLLVARILNAGRPGAVQQMPYESGMDPIHDTHRRFDVRFHLLAIAFLIFDVELLFLVPWAVAWGGSRQAAVSSRQSTVASQLAGHTPSRSIAASGSSGGAKVQESRRCESRHLVFVGAMTFLVLLTIGYVYDWRKGVFQWR